MGDKTASLGRGGGGWRVAYCSPQQAEQIKSWSMPQVRFFLFSIPASWFSKYDWHSGGHQLGRVRPLCTVLWWWHTKRDRRTPVERNGAAWHCYSLGIWVTGQLTCQKWQVFGVSQEGGLLFEWEDIQAVEQYHPSMWSYCRYWKYQTAPQNNWQGPDLNLLSIFTQHPLSPLT